MTTYFDNEIMSAKITGIIIRIEELLDQLDAAEDGRAPLDPVNARADEVLAATIDDPRGRFH